jgi:cytochrome c peroxidase
MVTGLFIAFYACTKIEDDVTPIPVVLTLPDIPYDYSTFTSGGLTLFTGINNNEASLGRVLFYDTHLSVNNSISCGSCHKQTIAFSDNVAFSAGFENHPTLRNTLPIQNLSNSGSFNSSDPSLFWDGRATMLQSMVLMPVLNHVEMGISDLSTIVNKVKALSYYNDLFVNTYGSFDVTVENVSRALSAFVRAITSANTRFDKYTNNLIQLSGIEEEGRILFFNKYDCNSCHQTQQLNGYQIGGGFVNIGLEDNYVDKGHENVSHLQSDNGKFKIPNLRNIALTGPYMHDGRFASLSAVLDHYSHGIKDHPALDPRLRETNGQPKRLNITSHEKSALIAFLNTMTDYSMITDPKYSNPFKAR